MIKLNTLKLQNFMCVENAELDFKDQKVIILLGDNGNGKSTVLDAISLCLTESKRGDSYKDYIRRGTKEAKIKLDAEVRGSPIIFDITINSTGTALDRKVTYLAKRKEPFVNSEVTTLLEELDLPFFGDILMSAQKADDITSKGPTDRANYLKKLLNFSFEKETAFCKDKIDRAREDIKKGNEHLDYNNNAITIKKNQIQAIPEDVYSDKKKEIESAIQTVQNQLSKYSGLTDKQRKLNESLNNVLQQKYVVSNSISTINTQIGNLSSMKEALTKYDDDNKKLSNDVLEITQLISNINAELVKLSNEQTELENTKSDFIKRIAEKSSELQTIKKHLSLIDSGKCPECGHVFTNSDKAEYEKAYNDTTEQLEKLNSESSINQNNLSEVINNKLSKNTELSTLSTKLATCNSTISNNTRAREQLNNQIMSLEQVSLSLPEKEQELKKLVESESAITNEQRDLEKSLKEYEELNKDLQNGQIQLNEITKQISLRDNIIKANDIIANEITALNIDSEIVQKSIEQAEKDEKVYKEAFTLLSKNLPDYLTVKTCDLLQEEMNNFIHVVFPEMEIRLFQNKKGIEFFYTKEQNYNKEDMSNAKMASGFEKDLLTLAFKVALCKLYCLPFAFFDEPDGHSSDGNAERLFKSLFTNGIFEQVFFISHKSGVRDIVKSNAEGVRTYYVEHGKFSLDSNY